MGVAGVTKIVRVPVTIIQGSTNNVFPAPITNPLYAYQGVASGLKLRQVTLTNPLPNTTIVTLYDYGAIGTNAVTYIPIVAITVPTGQTVVVSYRDEEAPVFTSLIAASSSYSGVLASMTVEVL